MKRKIGEWFSIQRAKKPGRIVLCTILLFNIIFILFSAIIISAMSLNGTEKMGFFEAAFCTVTMILDAGCVQFVINDIGQAGVAIALTCLFIIIIGMITFTGAVIGYVASYISRFIEGTDSSSRKMKLTNHIVILNWNTRASEIVNDVVYTQKKQTVIVLSNFPKESLEKEISERLSDTVHRENETIRQENQQKKWSSRVVYLLRHRFRNTVTVVVREGSVFSSKQLDDISLKSAKSVIILENDTNHPICKFQHYEQQEDLRNGNPQTIKTLMRVSDITEHSSKNQKIVVEVTDDWTADAVDRIIQCKGKHNIVPVRVNKVLGQLLAQFAVMPELNAVYKELFSNKGAEFYSTPVPAEVTEKNEISYNLDYLSKHLHSIPLSQFGDFYFYVSNDDDDLKKEARVDDGGYSVSLNENYQMAKKNIIILGHNSKCSDIMDAFQHFCAEWGEEAIHVVAIDDEESLKLVDNYENFNFVTAKSANICDRKIIYESIEQCINESKNDISILILSDDSVASDSIDSNSLTYLIYIQDIVNEKRRNDADFDLGSIDVIVEINDPKHYDVVRNYSTNNVVISNRYISKMIMQIGDKDALFDFYNDILTYDSENSGEYSSKEIYVKGVSEFFTEPPKECNAAQLIRAVLRSSTADNPEIVLGYVKVRPGSETGGELELFGGNQEKIPVELEKGDKLIVFSNH